MPAFNGIERRLDELNERLLRLQPLQSRKLSEFQEDAYLRDIVERNLEVAVQCCIDICHRIIALEEAQKPVDYYDAFLRIGELGIMPAEFARQLAPMAGFRNVLAHEYLSINWEIVYDRLQQLNDFEKFSTLIRQWRQQNRTGHDNETL